MFNSITPPEMKNLHNKHKKIIEDHINKIIFGMNKIEGIYFVYSFMNTTFQKAENYVNSLRNGHSNGVYDKVKNLISENKIIFAIKLYRDTTGFGLKEAKDYVFAVKNGKIGPPIIEKFLPDEIWEIN